MTSLDIHKYKLLDITHVYFSVWHVMSEFIKDIGAWFSSSKKTLRI